MLLEADALLGDAIEQLTDEERARRERRRLNARGITDFQLSDDEQRMVIPLSGRLFVVGRAGSPLRQIEVVRDVMDARLSPDGRRIGFVREGDLYVHEIDESKTTRLTDDADENLTNGLAEFVAQEEMGRFRGFWWSPDSARIAYQKHDISAVERLAIVDGATPEVAPRRHAYPRPGKPNADVRLGIVAASGGETTWIDWDRERYEYLASVTWVEHAPLTLLVQNRLQTEGRLLAVDDRQPRSDPDARVRDRNRFDRRAKTGLDRGRAAGRRLLRTQFALGPHPRVP